MKIRILSTGFFETKFKYRLLTWISYSRSTNRRINHLHERALRLKHDDYE